MKRGSSPRTSGARWGPGDAILLALTIALGLAIAWVDSRPHWDDSGITAGMLLLSAGAMGMIGPRRPWLWALGIGLWVPLHVVLQTPSIGNVLGSFVILAFPMAGAFAGMAVRRLLAHSCRPQA